MAIDPKTLLNWPFKPIEHTYTARDTMLYALGVGLGADPLDRQQLPFVYEADLRALPTFCVVLGTPGFWVKDPATGITWQKMLHGEQGFVLHRPLPAAGTIVAVTRVTGLVDKGADKGALVYVERDIRSKDDGTPLATLSSTYFCRADGGFGVSTTTAPKPAPIPAREPDRVFAQRIDPRAGLIYRLSGDYNPIHVDPAVATAAGFDAPIFHGLGTLGVAGHAVLRTLCDYRSERLTGMKLRFTAPVYPGETLKTEIWQEPDQAQFRCSVVERGVVVLDNGEATVAAE
jgi:acyl dehydratase